MHDVEAVLALVVLAVAGASLAERLRAPAPSLLVLAGLAVGFLPGVPALHVSPTLVTLGVLPPLLFAAAQQVSLLDLREVWVPVTLLAVGLVVVTAAVVAVVTHALDMSLSLAVGFMLGAILASTDPVAVTALSRSLHLPPRVATLVQSESLFNDATSLVLFQVAAGAAVSAGVGAGHVTWRFVQLAGGGVAVGVVAGLVASQLLRRSHDPTLQAALALITPYAAAVAAQALATSPVTAVIVAGLMIARRGARSPHGGGRLVSTAMYDVVVFLLENVTFAVIGLELAGFLRVLPASELNQALVLVLAITGSLLVVRGAALAIGLLPSHRSGSALRWRTGAVVAWAGARGVVPLAAALSIPLTGGNGAPFPHRPLLLVVAIGVVVITLVVQGTTLAPLVRRLGVAVDPQRSRAEQARVRAALVQAGLQQVDSMQELASPVVLDRLRSDLMGRAERLQVATEVGEDADDLAAVAARVLDAQAAELLRLRLNGDASAVTFRAVQRELDLERARLRE